MLGTMQPYNWRTHYDAVLIEKTILFKAPTDKYDPDGTEPILPKGTKVKLTTPGYEAGRGSNTGFWYPAISPDGIYGVLPDRVLEPVIKSQTESTSLLPLLAIPLAAYLLLK